MTDILVVDNSALRDLASCSRRALLRYWFGFVSPEESRFLRAGSAVHAAVADWLLSGGDLRRAMAELTLGYEEFGSDPACVQPDDRLSWANVRRVVQAWFEGHRPAELPWETEAVEEPFVLPLVPDGSVTVVGRIDGRGRDRQLRQRWLVEHKSTGRIDKIWMSNFHLDSQVSEYLWAQEQQSGELYSGAFINGIELSQAPSDAKRKCAKHGTVYAECGALHPNHQIVPVTRTPEELAAWHVQAVRMAERYWDLVESFSQLEQIASSPAEGKFHGACAFCFARSFCVTGANADAAENMFRVEPWQPFADSGGRWAGLTVGRWQQLPVELEPRRADA
jgi:hypothetical protein